MFRLRTLTMALLVVVLAGCATGHTLQQQPKRTAGAVIGAVGGGLAGSQFGGGRGKLITTAAGTLLGAWLGAEAGRSLDRADRAYAADAAYGALEYSPVGTTKSWSNPDSGRYGSFTPTRTYVSNNRDCREFRTDVVIDGRLESAYGTACRDYDGTWRMSN